MAFQNIGVGGTLSFDSGSAVAGMGRAMSGFMGLHKSAESVRGSMEKMSMGISKFNVVGAALGAIGGLSLGGLVKQGIDFNNEMEATQVGIATITKAITGMPMADALQMSEQAMHRLVSVAAEAPGELSDITDIFQKMVGPMMSSGATMNQILDSTKGTAIAAAALKMPFSDVGSAMSKLAAGTFRAGNDVHLMLRSMGLIHETTQEWKALLPEARLKRMNEILGEFAQHGELVGGGFDALKGTMMSIMKTMTAAFTSGIFERLKTRMKAISDTFLKTQDSSVEMAKNIGEKLGAAFDFVVEQVTIFFRSVKTAFNWAEGAIQRVSGLMERFGIHIGGDTAKNVAGIGFQFLAWTAMIAPVLTIGAKIFSMFSGLFTVISSVVEIAAALAWPLLVVAAVAGTVYLAFRNNHEALSSLYDSVGRLGTLFTGIAAQAMPMIDTIIDAFKGLATAFEAALKPVGEIIAQVVDLAVSAFELIAPRVVALVGPVIATILDIGTSLMGALGGAFSFIGTILSVVFGIVKAVVFPIVGFLLDIFIPIITVAFQVIGAVASIIFAALEGVFGILSWIVKAIIDEVKPAWLGMVEDMKAIGAAIYEFLETPIKVIVGVMATLLGVIVDIVNFVGGSAKGLAATVQSMKEFSGQKLTPAEKAHAQAALNSLGTKAAVSATGTQVAAAGAKTPSKEEKPKFDFNAKIDIKNKLHMDGRHVAAATARHQTEIEERAGFNQTPWQKQAVAISGTK